MNHNAYIDQILLKEENALVDIINGLHIYDTGMNGKTSYHIGEIPASSFISKLGIEEAMNKLQSEYKKSGSDMKFADWVKDKSKDKKFTDQFQSYRAAHI